MNPALQLGTWKEAKDHFSEVYDRALNNSLRGGDRKEKNGHGFSFVCKGCAGFLLVVRKRGCTFQMIEEMKTLEHQELCIIS
jgi:hypothetical protein